MIDSRFDLPRANARSAAPGLHDDGAHGAHRVRPDGRLPTPPSKPRSLPTARLEAEVAALDRMVGDVAESVDLAVEPALLDQLNRMADGYSAQTAPPWRREPVPRPRRRPPEPASARGRLPDRPRHRNALRGADHSIVARSGLAQDLSTQLAAGRETVRQILRIEPDSTVVRPPGGAALDDAAVEAMSALGASIILGNADTVARPPQPNGFAPLPTASLEVDWPNHHGVLPIPERKPLGADGVPRRSGAGGSGNPRRARDHLAGTTRPVGAARSRDLAPAGSPTAFLGCVHRTSRVGPVPRTTAQPPAT